MAHEVPVSRIDAVHKTIGNRKRLRLVKKTQRRSVHMRDDGFGPQAVKAGPQCVHSRVNIEDRVSGAISLKEEFSDAEGRRLRGVDVGHSGGTWDAIF